MGETERGGLGGGGAKREGGSVIVLTFLCKKLLMLPTKIKIIILQIIDIKTN